MVPLREEHLGFLPIWGREKQNVLGIAFDVKRKFSDLSRKKIEHQLAIRGGRYEDTPLRGTQPFRTDPADLMRDRRVWGVRSEPRGRCPPSLPPDALGHARLLGPVPVPSASLGDPELPSPGSMGRRLTFQPRELRRASPRVGANAE